MGEIPFTRDELVGAGPGGFVHQRVVRFQDTDAAGLIFFARALDYFHDAYVELLQAHGCSLPLAINERRWGAPMKHAEVHFVRPLRFGDPIDVEAVASRVGDSEGRIGWRIRALPSGEVAIVGQTQHVFIDFTTFKRRPIPPDALVAFTALPRL